MREKKLQDPKILLKPLTSSVTSYVFFSDSLSRQPAMWSDFLPPEVQSIRSTAHISRIDAHAHVHKHSDTEEESHEKEE